MRTPRVFLRFGSAVVAIAVMGLGCKRTPRQETIPDTEPVDTSPLPTSPRVASVGPPVGALPTGSGSAGGGKVTAPPGSAGPRNAHGDAPKLSLDSLTAPGKATLAAGKVTIVAFWATWCAPCRTSFPRLQALYAKYNARGLEIIGPAQDDQKDGILEFANSYDVSFPVGWDKGKALAKKWKIVSLPSTFVVDRQGKLAYRHIGFHDGLEDEIEREVASLL